MTFQPFIRQARISKRDEEPGGEKLAPDDVKWTSGLPRLNDDPLINIMLVGQDRREGQGRQRSDTMTLCSINTDTKQISLISFMRDLYVQIPGGYSDNRLNSTNAFGGFPLLNDAYEATSASHRRKFRG